MTKKSNHRVVIVGGGFGGLYTAQALSKADVDVTLIDKRNFHLFQPLLYQVATGGLSPAEIASPLRSILKKQKNAAVVQGEVADIDPERQRVILNDGALDYDTLVLATGVANHYFGREGWEGRAPGLKSIEDAIEIRRRVLRAFERAEREPDPVARRGLMTFVVIGGGPTGVELAGALAELAHGTLKGEFDAIDPTQTRIVLLEGQDAILPLYPPKSSTHASASLSRLGVEVITNALVEEIADDHVVYRQGDAEGVEICTQNVLWAAGMRATPLANRVHERTGAELDRAGRVVVTPHLHVPDHPNIFVIGDMACALDENGDPLPGIAPVAMQQGRFVANLIQARQAGGTLAPFQYRDKGKLAVIGRNAAVADMGALQFGGFPAWLAWVTIHLWYLIEFDNKIMVLLQWAWNYFTRKRGARLITEEYARGRDRAEVSDPALAELAELTR